MTKILECSSVGDKRFSAFYANVEYGGRETNIERHYQSAKFFKNKPKKVKGVQPDGVLLKTPDGKKEILFKTEFLTPWYKLLWLMYFDANPQLLEYAAQFDEFNDVFKGKSLNCQADVVRQFVLEGRESVFKEVEPLIKILKERME